MDLSDNDKRNSSNMNHTRSRRHSSGHMMDSIVNDSFDMMMPNMMDSAMANGFSHLRNMAQSHFMPFGFPDVNSDLENFMKNDRFGNDSNSYSYSSRTVMTMKSGSNGRPEMYQASTSTRTVPGGVKETKKTICDSRTGTKKMSIGHHIGDRAHIIEREQNINSGEQEEREELINLDEGETQEFNREFESKARGAGAMLGSLGYHGDHSHRHHHHHQRQKEKPLHHGHIRKL